MGSEPRQFTSKQLHKARQALRARAAHTPESNELYHTLLGLGKRSLGVDTADQDRLDAEVAVIGPAYIDSGLEKAITTHFNPMIEPTRINHIFHGDQERPGVLTDIAGKIDIAYALGILTSEAREDLHSIRIIRNSFAHAMFRLSMADAEVSALIDHIHVQPFDDMTGIFQAHELRRFVLSYILSTYYWQLDTYRAGRPSVSP